MALCLESKNLSPLYLSFTLLKKAFTQAFRLGCVIKKKILNQNICCLDSVFEHPKHVKTDWF